MQERQLLPDSGVLGLAAFVVSQALLNIPNAHLVPAYATPMFLTTTLFAGGAIQLLCAIFEYVRGNQFSMTVFGTFGAFFTALSMFILWEINGTIKYGPAGASALGTFLLIWTILAIVFTIPVFKAEKALGVMFIFVDLAFLGGTLANLVGLDTAFGGWAGIISCLVGIYLVYKGLMAMVSGHAAHNTATAPQPVAAAK